MGAQRPGGRAPRCTDAPAPFPSPSLSPAALTSVVALAHDAPGSLAVTDLADHAGYSPFHFTRLFAASTGVTPGVYLTALRMERAKHLLLTQEHSVIDIATEVGYGSLSSFSRGFTASVGVPPGGLRRLADRVADRPPLPFERLSAERKAVSVRLDLPMQTGDPLVWVGWFRQPAPIGLPASGILARGRIELTLPVHPGAPWLLGFAVAPGADVHDHLAPARPLVVAHPRPLTAPARVTLRFDEDPRRLPFVAALPALERR